MAAVVYALRLAEADRLDGLAYATGHEPHHRTDFETACGWVQLPEYDESNVVDLAAWAASANHLMTST